MKAKINQKQPKIKLQLNPIDENGYPKPKKVKCFRCQQRFWLRFLFSKKNYSLKNNWGYWTNKVKDKKRWICNLCLRNFYLTERQLFLETIKDLKKRNNLRSYIGRNFV